MPFLKYFGFVGGILLLLLLALNWLLPEAKTELAHSGNAKPAIRISSIEQLPEKVEFDTNAVTIASATANTEINSHVPQSAFVLVQITPGSLPSFTSPLNVVRTAETGIMPRSGKQLGSRPPKSHSNAASDGPTPAASTIRLSLIDDMRSRFGRSSFMFN
jgi:hypothetical protein